VSAVGAPMTRIKLAIARRKLTSLRTSGKRDALEEWEHNKARAEARRSKELQAAMSGDEVTQADMEEYQLHMLRAQLEYVEANSPYYREKLKAAGVRPSEIRSWRDLERIPPTDPSELAAEPMRFLCARQKDIMRAFTTSGTSGQRKRLFYTRGDVLNIIDSIAAALKSQGMDDDGALHIMFPAVDAWDPALMLDGGCKVAGFRSVVCSSPDVDEQVAAMREGRATMIIGLTSFIFRVTMLARGRHDLRSLGIKAIICSAEPMPEAMRREIASAWGCKAVSQYGMTEMGLATTIECGMNEGLHINDADFIVEAVDEDGRQVRDGEKGELLWTSLSMKGTPLIRYRSGDTGYLIPPPCRCGIVTGRRMVVTGRKDAQIKIGYGQKIYPMLFDEALLSIPGVMGYQLTITREGYRDVLSFRIEADGALEETARSAEEAIGALDEISAARANDLIAPPSFDVVDARGQVYEPKRKRIADLRPLFDR